MAGEWAGEAQGDLPVPLADSNRLRHPDHSSNSSRHLLPPYLRSRRYRPLCPSGPSTPEPGHPRLVGPFDARRYCTHCELGYLLPRMYERRPCPPLNSHKAAPVSRLVVPGVHQSLAPAPPGGRYCSACRWPAPHQCRNIRRRRRALPLLRAHSRHWQGELGSSPEPGVRTDIFQQSRFGRA